MNNETLLLKPKPIEEDQKMILRGPIHKTNNRPCFYVLQKSTKGKLQLEIFAQK